MTERQQKELLGLLNMAAIALKETPLGIAINNYLKKMEAL
jgi:hypothetical protein